MSKLKLSFSFLLTLMLVAMFSIVASAAPDNSNTPGSYNSDVTGLGTDMSKNVQTTAGGLDNSYDSVTKTNANKTGSGVWVNDGTTKDQVLKSTGLKKADGTHNQRTHGEYQNNTNSCASCHQTHTGASEGLLFKDGKYATCTACHDGTLGFYNVMTGSNSAGTFGGTHDGNMSAHLADGSVKLNAAPGGNFAAKDDATSTRGGEWTEEFTCANCHAPHGSYSDRLLNEDPNGMANTLIKDGGKKLESVPVLDKTTLTDLTTKQAAGNITYKDATNADLTVNYIAFRFQVGDLLQPTNLDKNSVDQYPAAMTAAGLKTGDWVVQIMKWVPKYDKDGVTEITGSKYVIDTDPFIHEYDFDTTHTKHYWTAFYSGATYDATYADPDYVGKYKDTVDTDRLKNGEVLGQGFLAAKTDASFLANAKLITDIQSVKFGNVARGYVVKLAKVLPTAGSTDDINNLYSTDVSALWASKFANGTTNPAYVSNRGVAMSGFCAACHTDYLAVSGKETGTFDHAYRHNTTSDSYTCVRCHFAHGTDLTVMRDARGLTYNEILTGDTARGGDKYFTSTPYDATVGADNSARKALVTDYLKDKNPSSVLKRYTNMAVCWGCHTSSHSGGTRNTDTYQYNATPGVDTDRNGIEFDY
ncbi:cytochrome c3 family protein [Neobacillus sp. PS3-40]|uniref:cytochrome c3 family protein n=1 Tax=Neobacillus sp. PS3-40 TaxID=3070679 RepID=UPI0027DEE18A|nr:cytochrome c3 family protein [Neobacillus sp. PS3-40]WML46056.1 cytochrome c3 family protein [Neobacillus sp. PS3-40]